MFWNKKRRSPEDSHWHNVTLSLHTAYMELCKVSEIKGGGWQSDWQRYTDAAVAPIIAMMQAAANKSAEVPVREV